ncbi:MAG TPA: cytochrome P450 [Acidimicrobiales bacterium]
MAVAFDPFEAGYDAWPYDQYRRLREAEPVHWSELLSGWVVTRFASVARLLRDGTMSSDLDKASPSPLVDMLRARSARRQREAGTLVLEDDPAHARLRRLIQAPFTARAVEAIRASVRQRVDEHVAALAARPSRSFELVADFAYPLPVAVFCDMLGIPAEAGPRFREWTAATARSLDLVIGEEEFDACTRLIDEMEAYLAAAAEEKRARPGDDVLTALVTASLGDDRLTPAELVAQLVTLYVAGHEPTTALIANGLSALLDHPEQLARLQAAPELIPHAVLELLRYDGPNQFVRRVATVPVDLAGDGSAVAAPGDVVYLAIGAANHDPERWGPTADDLDVERPDAGQHLQFGGGIHHCLGAHLARMQAEVALTALLTRLPGLRRAGPTTWSGRTTLRSAATLPLAR